MANLGIYSPILGICRDYHCWLCSHLPQFRSFRSNYSRMFYRFSRVADINLRVYNTYFFHLHQAYNKKTCNERREKLP